MKNIQTMENEIKLNTNTLFHLRIFNGTKSELIDRYINNVLKEDQDNPLVIFTPNPEQIVQAQQDQQFLSALQTADVLIPDGAGIVWASRLLSSFGLAEPLKQRITGVDLVYTLLEQFPETRFAVVGGRDETGLFQPRTLSVGQQTLQWFPAYKKVNTPTVAEEENLRAHLHQARPEVVLVAFGAPFQEEWVVRHRKFLADQGVKVIMVVGGTIDIMTGKVRRAPTVIQKLGLEWLYRLIQQPWRWKRQLRLITFMKLVISQVSQSREKNA